MARRWPSRDDCSCGDRYDVCLLVLDVIVRALLDLHVPEVVHLSTYDVRLSGSYMFAPVAGILNGASRAARRSGKRSNLVTGHGLETSVAWASVAGPCDAAIADGGATQIQRTQLRRNGRFAGALSGCHPVTLSFTAVRFFPVILTLSWLFRVCLLLPDCGGFDFPSCIHR